ncbi:MAG: HD domain-containing protein [Alphaproteobacteria bacterium]|nr:HD domain-containing protein [Alphaproteobacteria bacterium]MCB9974841.1 HD domain-containing protein [Rhodospirillales bacterium]
MAPETQHPSYPSQPSNGWPDAFDFRTDEICQTLFKPYILDQLKKLAEYDAQRPPGTVYIFHEHARRVAQDVRDTCRSMGLSEQIAENMYWAVLIHDIGKMHFPPHIWDTEEKPDEDTKAHRRTHTEKGGEEFEAAFAEVNHPFKDLALEIMHLHHEQVDGQGPMKMPGEKLSPPVRLTSIVEAFDGWSIPRPHFGDRDTSPPAVIERMRGEKSHMFDPELLESFAKMKLAAYK